MQVKNGIYLHHHSFKEEIAKAKNILLALLSRDLFGQYRRSSLGILWAVFQPLAYMLVFNFLRGVLSISSDGMPYAIFSYSALVPWTFFSTAIGRCGSSVAANIGIIKKISIMREVFPLNEVLNSLVNFGISFLILIAMVFIYQRPITWAWLWLPFLIITMVLLTLGIGLGIAAIVPYRGDVMFLVPLAIQFWMLLSPIVYPISMVPEKWALLYKLNPVVGVLEGFRQVMVNGLSPDLSLLGFSWIAIVIIWLITWPVFRFSSQYFAEVY